MDDISKLIQSISSLIWPLIFIVFMIAFYSPLVEVIRSATSRKFTVEIAGQKFTMEEVRAEQQKLITDLQSQVAEIRKQIGASEESGPQASASKTPVVLSSLLWVDDDPRNNSFFVEELRRLGVRVDLASTTREGIALFRSGRYSAVISDMGRAMEPRAGLELLRAVREADADIPFFIFSSERGVVTHRQEAMDARASGITASPAELYALLNLDELRKKE